MKSRVWKTVIFTIGSVITMCHAANAARPVKVAIKPVITQMHVRVVAFTKSCDELQAAVNSLDALQPTSIQNAKAALLNCRYQYKQIEFFLEYFFIRSARIYNGPPKAELEQSETGYPEPVGFQQIEAILFSRNIAPQKEKLAAQTAIICNSARELPALLADFKTSDRQILQSLRQELTRIITLGITGYDAPLLKSGVTEAYYALLGIQTALGLFLKQQPSVKLNHQFSTALAYLKMHPDFDSFNRMHFLTSYVLPLQQALGAYTRQAKLEVTSTGIFNNCAKNIFSPNAFNKAIFLDTKANQEKLVALGRRLFFEKRLSGPSTRSCASCHQPERYFTDGLPQSVAIDGHAHVLRNAPTLLYAGFQYSQFWDARVKTLVAQVKEVLDNKQEMAANDSVIVARIAKDKNYLNLFKAAYPAPQDQHVSLDGIAEGIAAYVISLSPRNSPFDRYMNGDKLTLTSNQIHGFNLFMGKAQCGTCHFAPLFNGLIPPVYQTTELEIIGVPKSDNRKNVQADDDEGSYRIYPVSLNRGAFKTPTVRNAAKTGPYMHNGAFHTLTNVVDFYNAGGGNGWGLNNAQQTLSSDSLKLSKREVKAIIGFLNSLTDKPARLHHSTTGKYKHQRLKNCGSSNERSGFRRKDHLRFLQNDVLNV